MTIHYMLDEHGGFFPFFEIWNAILLCNRLEGSLGGRQLVVIDVATDGHAEGTCQRFEDAFDFVVLVGAFGLDVEIHSCGIAQALEEVQEHLCWHFAYALAMEFGIPHQPRAPTEVECHGAEAVVHGQTVAIAFDATLVP